VVALGRPSAQQCHGACLPAVAPSPPFAAVERHADSPPPQRFITRMGCHRPRQPGCQPLYMGRTAAGNNKLVDGPPPRNGSIGNIASGPLGTPGGRPRGPGSVYGPLGHPRWPGGTYISFCIFEHYGPAGRPNRRGPLLFKTPPCASYISSDRSWGS
jgi:hypothetical protein